MTAPTAPPLTIAPSSAPLRLDLACGQTPQQGFEGVDFFCTTAKHVVNLQAFPWPWADDSVDELFSSHFVEHLPMVYVSASGNIYKTVPDDPGDRDLFMRFFDESYRILKPGGKFTVIVPNARSDRGFQDPTHRRFIVPPSFCYLMKPWREANGLDHYLGSCNFEVTVEPITDVAEEVWSDEVKAKRYRNYWNVVDDWKATLVAIKADPKVLPPSLPGYTTPVIPMPAPGHRP